MFCQGLKNNSVNVLGIGEQDYDSLPLELKNSLTEYYYVHSLEDYDEKYRAVAYFIHKYGRIDFLESNNEYWLESDAKLRSDFNISTGPNASDIEIFKSKSKMKEYYHKAQVKTAQYSLPKSLSEAEDFINRVGFPVIIKPDIGVGASKTYKLSNHEELKKFFDDNDGSIQYIMEEYISGDLVSFDGICDQNGDVVICSHHVFPTQIMNVVNDRSDCFYYTSKIIPQALINVGTRVVKAFNARSRFFHLEFFINKSDGELKEEDIIGLEVNMRVPGGFTPDMIDYAYSINIYQIWADVMAFNMNLQYIPEKKQYCAFYGRRYNHVYRHSEEEIKNKYLSNLKVCGIMPIAIADAMGDYYFIATFDSLEEINEFRNYLQY